MPTGPRKEPPPIPAIRRAKVGGQKPTFAEQLAPEMAKLKANEATRATLDQAPYDEATLEGDMETAGDFRPAAVEEGDVPSWDAADIKESAMGGMGMAPELDTDQHRFGDPRALNMVQTADLPASKKKESWTSKAGNIEIDLEAMGVGAADIYELEPGEQVKALKTELDPSGVAERTPVLSRLEEDMPEQQLEAVASAFGEGFGPEGKQAAKEAVGELKGMPKAKKERTLNGITNLGVFISEWKSDLMAGVIGAAARKTDEGSFMNRLLRSGKEYYERKSASSRKLIESETKLASLAGATTRMSKVGSILSWGRVGLDIVGKGAFAKHLNPFRHMTAGAMAIGASAEVLKETRFKANSLKEKTRMDVESAEEEARALYEETARKSGGKVTAEALSAVYQERLPQDLIARLNENFMAGSSFVGHVIKKDLAWGVERIQGKLDKIDTNKKLNDAQKAQKRQELLVSYNGFLREADLMTTKYVGVDAASYGARLVEKSAKAFVTVMAVDTIARLFMSAHDLFDRNFGSGTAVGAAGAKAMESLPQGDVEVMTAESRELPSGIVSVETIGAGGSITGSLMKQLEEHPEKFGYTGETGRSSEQLHAWAFKTAKAMAKQAGFLTRKDQQDTWLSHAAVGRLRIGVDMSHGKPELAMVDEKNHVISAAELKAGPYGMKVPFADKGEAVPTPEVVPPPESSYAPAHDYYVKKMLGAAAGKMDPKDRDQLGLTLNHLRRAQAVMHDEHASPASRAQARELAVADLREISKKYDGIMPKGWTEKLEKTPTYAEVLAKGAGPVHEEMGPPAPPREETTPPVEKPIRRVVRPVEPAPEPVVEKKAPPSHVEEAWEADRREFAIENLKRAQAIIGGKALEGLTQEQRVEVGKLLRVVDLRHQALHASVADGALSVGDEIRYGQPYRQAVAELEEKYGKVLPEKWLGKLTRYMHPGEAGGDHEHGGKGEPAHEEEKAPAPPPVKPLRRPVRAPELEPVVDAGELSPDVQPLLVTFKGALAGGFENLDAKGDISKETVLRLLDAVHKAKEGLKSLPTGDPARRALIAEAQQNAKILTEVFGGVVGSDWFEKV